MNSLDQSDTLAPTPRTDASEQKMYETRPHDYEVEQTRIKLSKELERESDCYRKTLEEIANAKGFENVGNWARNKAKAALSKK